MYPKKPEKIGPDQIEHPGKILLDRVINGKDLTMRQSADLLGISEIHLSYIVHRRSGLSAEMCLRIAAVFGENAEEWAGLQSKYDLAYAEEKIKNLNLAPYKI